MRMIVLVIAGLAACGSEQAGRDAGPEEGPSSEAPPAAGETPEASSAPWDAARARGVEFRAIGQEPGWLLEIDDRWMLFVYEYGADTVRVRVPEPEREGHATVYRAETNGHALLARIETADCQDIMSGERFPATVSVELDGREFQGCGRSLDPGAAGASARSCEAEPPPPARGSTVAVYFNCPAAAPGELVPVHRRVEGATEASDASRLETAMRALVAGPTPQERERGFVSFFSEGTGIEVLDTSVSEGGDSARVDFTSFKGRLPDRHGVKSFLPPGVMAELTWTLFQSFPDLQAVRFSFDGSETAFWAWLGGEPQVFTRRDWEQI